MKTSLTFPAAPAAALVAAVLGLSLAPARALSYTATPGNLTAPAGVTFTTVGGPLTTTTSNGFTILSAGTGEIFGARSLSISFDQPVSLDLLTLGLLYPARQFPADIGNETAVITLNDSPAFRFTLTATGVRSATWTGTGSVANLSAGVRGGAAVWQIRNPFASVAVNKVTFSAAADGYSDFGVVGFRTVSTPEGAGSTLALLGGAMLGIVALRRMVPPRNRLA